MTHRASAFPSAGQFGLCLPHRGDHRSEDKFVDEQFGRPRLDIEDQQDPIDIGVPHVDVGLVELPGNLGPDPCQ